MSDPTLDINCSAYQVFVGLNSQQNDEFEIRFEVATVFNLCRVEVHLAIVADDFNYAFLHNEFYEIKKRQ